MLTDEQLAEWERLASEATPGPHQVVMVEGAPQCGVWAKCDKSGAPVFGSGELADGFAYVCSPSQVKLLSASRAAVLALVAEVRRLRVELETALRDARCWTALCETSAAHIASEHERLTQARREGAEEMRERAARTCAAAGYGTLMSTSDCEWWANRIRAVPLPGEE